MTASALERHRVDPLLWSATASDSAADTLQNDGTRRWLSRPDGGAL